MEENIFRFLFSAKHNKYNLKVILVYVKLTKQTCYYMFKKFYFEFVQHEMCID